ncbi:LysM peptidoglycan-binding domain-containing protein [Ensifer adhaerens]|uniref:LysM peptidoglycan-binding domain-containing protein n=1 Tax=Ensifer adhaerens TaxID=106592 RepID=UPI001CC04783|nr:LysM peptidoglycan-binding domain-containing protein [Ensifer adhaerens]MBZ7921002.1 LysM peptidoglycan-binding domain-containing protein [Ensifer adhaerens]UAX93449.1 LysM peptidoglycan-binding domain-containing protein [Ensifer adhaerens]UAY01086.1 LysM peptidoglycan-binding domain-containing protein [Ensifer adhaerens]UAY08467.1 LysM peptidoglycan-binding domain-containing protein [Ensifer adhaerens]
MIKNKAGWVAITVLVAATALMVFVVQPNLRGDGKKPADEPVAGGATQSNDTASASGGPQATDATAKPQDAKAAEAAKSGEAAGTAAEQTANAAPTNAPAENPAVPGFDVLRVEPDGSTVIAGHAEPGSKLEILSGDTVVGTADVGATGDFAAVFDKPLPAGDYQLTLRSTGEDGTVKSSEEVATVSVPKDPSGQLLAMVSKPGEASRLMTTPEAGKTEAGQPAEVASTATQSPLATGDASSAPAKAVGVPGLQVSAVEIEGSKMFVAGSAKPRALVRVYADDKLLGEMKADDKGNFVVDGEIELTVGSHIIRADMLNEDGSKVAMRASVPFDRPAGSQVAAVAPSSTPSATAGLDGVRAEAGKALALLKGLYANGKVPTGEQLAAARSATEIALKSLADFRLADNSDQVLAATAARASKAAADALAALKAAPQDAPSVASALAKVDASVGPVLAERGSATPASDEQALPKGNAPAQGELAKAMGAGSAVVSDAVTTPAPSTETAAASPTQEEPQTVQQEPLKESKSSVIIRRGDTLWQISRRVYGAGLRYTTIYLANQDQIEDPDRIRPGQVFGVPDKALPDDESREIHRKHMKHEQ